MCRSWITNTFTVDIHFRALKPDVRMRDPNSCDPFPKFRNLFKIRKYLNKESAATVVYAFVTSKPYYCNSLFYGLPNYQLRKLQLLEQLSL